MLWHCRVGRVLVRKLLLRGYTVSALVRDPTTHNLPQSVTVFQGDLADYDSCRRALQGVDKVRTVSCLLACCVSAYISMTRVSCGTVGAAQCGCLLYA